MQPVNSIFHSLTFNGIFHINLEQRLSHKTTWRSGYLHRLDILPNALLASEPKERINIRPFNSPVMDKKG